MLRLVLGNNSIAVAFETGIREVHEDLSGERLYHTWGLEMHGLDWNILKEGFPHPLDKERNFDLCLG